MPQIENRITAGNLYQIAAMLVGLALAWGSLSSSSAEQTKDIADHEARLRVMEQVVASDLSKIKTQLDRIERAQP
jgi:hypothetical protein